MRKETNHSSKIDKDDLISKFHDMWDSCDDEMDRLELKGYVDDENMPKFKDLNGDDRIGVSEVLIIGGYIALNKLHNEMHPPTSEKDVEVQIKQIMNGTKTVKQVAPENIPDEVLDALQDMVDAAQKMKRNIRKGKK